MGTIRAKDCAEALLRVLMLKAAARGIGRAASPPCSASGWCGSCATSARSPMPRPAGLAATGHSRGARAGVLSPPPAQARRGQKEPCRECGGIGYKGQTAIFELLVVDDTVRKVLATTPKLDLLRQAARKAGMKSLQEEGILLVARGVTSLPELMRVMKQ